MSARVKNYEFWYCCSLSLLPLFVFYSFSLSMLLMTEHERKFQTVLRRNVMKFWCIFFCVFCLVIFTLYVIYWVLKFLISLLLQFVIGWEIFLKINYKFLWEFNRYFYFSRLFINIELIYTTFAVQLVSRGH